VLARTLLVAGAPFWPCGGSAMIWAILLFIGPFTLIGLVIAFCKYVRRSLWPTGEEVVREVLTDEQRRFLAYQGANLAQERIRNGELTGEANGFIDPSWYRPGHPHYVSNRRPLGSRWVDENGVEQEMTPVGPLPLAPANGDQAQWLPLITAQCIQQGLPPGDQCDALELQMLMRAAKLDPAATYHLVRKRRTECTNAMIEAMRHGISTANYSEFDRLEKRAQMARDVIEKLVSEHKEARGR
jgi:hypothetical protein